jgi:hypothetical protein
MLRFLALAALTAASPALAHDGAAGWSSDVGHRLFETGARHRPVFGHLGHDGLWWPRQFSRDDGYFQGRGDGVRISHGQARFDYDRHYAFDLPPRWGSDGGPAPDHHAEDGSATRHCSEQPVRDRRSGEQVLVTICR